MTSPLFTISPLNDRRPGHRSVIAIGGTLLLCFPLHAQVQSPDLTTAPPRPHAQYVTFTAEPQLIAANRPGRLELHFQIRDGFHINSHSPASELQIPTRLDPQPAPGVRLTSPIYPTGQAFRVAEDTLDVYTGTFTLMLPVTATPGDHTLAATLTYQACDHVACYPPRTLPLQIQLTAR